jgi:hypothetical protein
MNLNQQLHIQREINRERTRLEKYRTSHFKHFVLSVLTLGIWLPVWLLVSASNANERMKSQKRLDSLEMSLSFCEVE